MTRLLTYVLLGFLTVPLLAAPALAGLAAPWWKSQATAAISGMTLSTERGTIVLAVLQGIAAQVAELISAIDSDAPPLNRLRADPN